VVALSKKKGGLRAGDVVEVAVEKGVYRGLGLARHEGRVVFVPHVLTGERVRVRVERVGRGYAEARLVDLLAPAAERRASPCPYAPRCGGCAHQEMDYAAQLRLKEAVLADALARSSVPWDRPVPVGASPETGWRTRASFHLAPGPSGLRLGLYEEGSHRVVDLEVCLQLSEGLNRTARSILEALRPRPAWASMVRAVDLAESGDGSRRVACLHVAGDVGLGAPLAALAGEVPWLTGLAVAGEGGGRAVVLSGEPYVESAVDGITFRSHVGSFFQGNRHLVEPLARAVLDGVPVGGNVLDLYCGVGLFALLAARRGAVVRGAESNAQAVDDATVNAARARIKDVRFEALDVAAALKSWPVNEGEAVILDPPRTGAGPAVVEALAARRPGAIVYVSCDPPTLGRDLRDLIGRGYLLEDLRAFDLFPDTFHIETVAVLRRA
jgi:23S rRNA (uracil1939-C5)-methyltransferase